MTDRLILAGIALAAGLVLVLAFFRGLTPPSSFDDDLPPDDEK